MALSRTQKLTRFVSRWAADPARRAVVRDASLARLEQALATRNAHVVATSASDHGTWLCGEGQARVLAGDLDGWQELRLGCAVMRCSRVVAHRNFPQARGRTEPCEPIGCANAVALSLSLDDPDADELYRWHQNGWPAPDRLPPYAVYVQALLDLRERGSTERIGRCGFHDEVLRAWERDDLGARLDEALEWHTGPGVDGSDGATGEFLTLVAHAFPVEVLAALAVRRRRGLALPALSHPLGLTALCATHPSGPWPSDPLLERLLSFIDTLPTR